MPPAPMQDHAGRHRPRPARHRTSSPIASPGAGTDDHLQLVLLQAATGVRLTHVVFQGDPQLRTAMLGRQVD